MPSLSTLLAGLALVTAVLGSYGYTYKLGGDNRETALKAEQYKGDTDLLLADSRTMVNAFKATQRQMNDLRKTSDPSAAPASVVSTITSLCDQRKARGVPCSPAKPTNTADNE